MRRTATAEAHGDCRVPNRHKTAEGLALGQWVSDQRKAYGKGELSAARMARLEAVDGWVWDSLEAAWEAGLAALAAYREVHGHCRVPRSYKTAEGLALGAWVGTQRTAYGKGASDHPQLFRIQARSCGC